MEAIMNQVPCACGCGELRNKFDKKGVRRYYISGHQNRRQTQQQIDAYQRNFKKRPRAVWNKGKTYVFASKKEYANKGAWNKAMRRLYPDQCMRCGWNSAPCDTHHITPKNNGGKYTIENGVILCPNCHRLADFELITVDELKSCKKTAQVIGEIV
jgi:predicted restriction endonuclease